MRTKLKFKKKISKKYLYTHIPIHIHIHEYKILHTYIHFLFVSRRNLNFDQRNCFVSLIYHKMIITCQQPDHQIGMSHMKVAVMLAKHRFTWK